MIPTAATSAKRVRDFLVRGAREIVWDDLEEGVLDLEGLPGATRLLARAGFVMLLAMVAVLFVSGIARGDSLIPLSGSLSGRGSVMPVPLLPVTLFALAVAWGFMLTGALHARRLVRVGVVGVYLFFAVLWTAQITGVFTSVTETVLAWALIFAVPLYFAARWRKRPRAGMEFVVVFSIVSLTFAIAQRQGMDAWRISGIATVFQSMDVAVETIAFIAVPLFFLIGLDIAEFTYRLSEWTSDAVSTRLPVIVLRSLLVVVVLWRLYGVFGEFASRAETASLPDVLLSYSGALLVPVLVGVVWLVVFRRETATADEIAGVARRAGPPLVVMYFGTLVIIFVVFLVASAVALLLGSVGVLEGIASVDSERVTGLSELWISAVSVIAMLGAGWFARRGSRVIALYLGIVGANGLWNNLTAQDNTLDLFTWEGPEPVVFWIVVLALSAGGYWMWQRRLSGIRARNLLLVLLATVLFEHTGFIEDPFSPLIGFSGIAIIAVGVIWDALSFGAWANSGSPVFPRTSRIFLYIGYVLFGVAVVNWSVATHDLEGMSNYTGGLALAGFNLLGKPLLYAIFAILLTAPLSSSESTHAGHEPAEKSE